MRKIVTISLPESTARQVDSFVTKEGYASTSEFFRDLLREWDRRTDCSMTERMKRVPQFRVSAFIRAVKRHAQKGGIKTLSRDHDSYLYGK